jgi:hypothetical protein
MFEQELEMEKKSSSILPLLLMIGMIVAVVGVALHFVLQSREVLETTEATPVITAILDNQLPAVLKFETGNVRGADNPHDPNYKLLQKAGYITIGKDTKDWKTPIALTPAGTAFLADLSGVKKVDEAEGRTMYKVPLAQRKLVEIGKITMKSTGHAIVEYSWKWEPNKAGDLMDASGDLVKGFNSWERSTLIDKYGANFYHAAPTKTAILLVKTEKGWQISNE